jgi:hypothetical protein
MPTDDRKHGEGRDLRACPDSEDAVLEDEVRHTFALVTQTLRGEVAAIDLTEEEVVDEDPSVPGTEFLQVGANPTAIASTPGGVATFVGVGEPGLWAIYALPTSCIVPPAAGEPTRDIALWSSCRLPSAPGEMLITVDQAKSSDGGSYRKTCAPESATDWIAAAELEADSRRQDCPANLEDEELIGPHGRRKLVVTLPDRGLVAIYDAQAILNLPAGSFDECVPDRVIPLSTRLPSEEVAQPVPAELVPAPGCTVPPTRYDAITYDPSNGFSRPADIALAGSKLYVADLGVPLIHAVDLADPCTATEGEPLRPLSYESPDDAVYAERLAVSDLLPSGKRYMYATVAKEGTAMVFDVSPDSTSKAPLLRNGSVELPDEPPDRIVLPAPIKAMSLVTHDVPAVDDATDTAALGVLCDPNPKARAPGSLYRVNTDYTEGAAPRKLRGLFGVLAMSSGEVAAIDIEDWDAPCRRPATNNPNAAATDWLGCVHDSGWSGERYERGANLTVTDEVSCNVFRPHRLRSGKYLLNDPDFGANGPNLSGFPLLTGGTEGQSASTSVDAGKTAPKMLAVPYSDVDCDSSPKDTRPFSFVGSTKYEACAIGQDHLDMAPETAQENSLLLPLREPRVYSSTEAFTATYEGIVLNERANGALATIPTGEVVEGLGRPLAGDELLLRDVDARFCDQGVQDRDINLGIARDLSVPDDQSQLFASNHGDFVVLMSDFLDSDPYFDTKAVLKRCGVEDLRKSCEEWFGTADDPLPDRELLVREAYHDKLVLTPKNADALTVAQKLKQIHCCFPAVHSYEVRAASQWVVRGNRLLHDIVPGPDLRCMKDCSPRRSRLKSRVFEISSTAPECEETTVGQARPDCFIGAAKRPLADEVCYINRAKGSIKPSELEKVLPSGCVFDSLKGRFAIYRGLQKSVRDMKFSWTINGGFTGLGASLVSSVSGRSVGAVDMLHAEPLDAMIVVDGVSGGVSLLSLGNFAIIGNPYQ